MNYDSSVSSMVSPLVILLDIDMTIDHYGEI